MKMIVCYTIFRTTNTEVVMSLLYLSPADNRARRVNDDIFSNLNIDKLLDDKTLDVMALSITKDELLCRREVFRRLLDCGLYRVFYKLRAELADLDSCFYVFDKSTNLLEQIFRAKNVFESYKRAWETVTGIDPNGNPLLQQLKDHLQTMDNAIAKLDKFSKDHQEELDAFSRGRIRLGGGASLVAPSNGSCGTVDQFVSLAQGIGIDITDPMAHSRNVKLNDHFAANYCIAHRKRASVLSAYPKLIADLDRGILNYRDEVDFYIKVCDLVTKASTHGIKWVLPHITDSKCFNASNVYDISLLGEGVESIVPNDVWLSQAEHVFFIIGANGGGKTSYLRAVAINALLATAGCPIFAEAASIYSFNKIYTHFPADESFTGSGRFLEEKQRTDIILNVCGENDLVFMNETFSGTDEQKGSDETVSVARRLNENGCMGLIVTHFGAIPFDNYPVLCTDVNGEERTFRIIRRDKRINAHADDILKKYDLTSDLISKRLQRRNSNGT